MSRGVIVVATGLVLLNRQQVLLTVSPYGARFMPIGHDSSVSFMRLLAGTLSNLRWSGRAVNKVHVVLRCRAAQLWR
jgi:hypothetical protein